MRIAKPVWSSTLRRGWCCKGAKADLGNRFGPLRVAGAHRENIEGVTMDMNTAMDLEVQTGCLNVRATMTCST